MISRSPTEAERLSAIAILTIEAGITKNISFNRKIHFKKLEKTCRNKYVNVNKCESDLCLRFIS